VLAGDLAGTSKNSMPVSRNMINKRGISGSGERLGARNIDVLGRVRHCFHASAFSMLQTHESDQTAPARITVIVQAR